MGRVSIGISMSLDGFVAGPNDSPERPLGEGGDVLFEWYSKGGEIVEVPSGDHPIKMSTEAAERVKDAARAAGALVYGRRTFDIANAWGGKHPMDVPMVIVTHRVPREWVKPGSPFTFVTDGVQNAIQQALKIADGKDVVIGSADVMQQAIKLGLLDDIHIDLVPVLLGGGVSLFDHLGGSPINLECTGITRGPGVTHLDFRVVK
jgi:dihydrofolate reductase